MTLMKFLLPFLLLCAANGQARAQAPATPAAADPGLLSQRECFGGVFRSYDSWMAFLRRKNSLFAYAFIRWKFSEAEYDRYRNTLSCRLITYRSDGHVVDAWLVQPRNPPGGKAPVVLYNRGGNRELGAMTFAHLFQHVFPLAERGGFIVAASQYRGVGPTPVGQRSPDQFGGDDVRDVTNLLRLVVRLPRSDAGNIFMVGHSRGSIMTFRALLDSPTPVRAVAIWSGVYDLRALMQFRPGFEALYEELIPGYARNKDVELDRRSVSAWADRLPARTGVLVVHGEADERAPLGAAQAFVAQLRKLGRPHKALFYPDESHFLDGRRDDLHAETVGWFRRFTVAPAALPRAAAP